MKNISEILMNSSFVDKPVEKAPPHELSATVNLIEQSNLFSEKYGRKYWLGKVKQAQISFSEMHGILKEIGQMDEKYNKGGRLTNVLTQIAKSKKNHGKK